MVTQNSNNQLRTESHSQSRHSVGSGVEIAGDDVFYEAVSQPIEDSLSKLNDLNTDIKACNMSELNDLKVNRAEENMIMTCDINPSYTTVKH